MLNKKNLFAVPVVALLAATTAVVLLALPRPMQTTTTRTTTAERQRTRKLAKPASIDGGANTSQTRATARNNSLRYDLKWVFGGKPQRGWNLYVPLISKLIGTEANAGTSEFASALARWQISAGLAANGVLDDATLYKMVETWQSSRIKERSYATPEQVLTAPVSDFYDPARPAELRQVERQAYAAYRRMLAAAIADPALGLRATPDGTAALAPSEQYLKIISAYRTREYQEQLRKREPHAGRAGLAVHSPHFTGRALDLYVGGEPVSTKDFNRAIQTQTRVYRWLVKNAGSYGFRPYYYEPWHWEYVGSATATSN